MKSFLRYAAIPVIRAVIVAAGVSFLAFALLEAAPSDSAEMIAIARYGAFGFSEQMVQNIRDEEGFNSPLAIRYVRWAAHIIRGDFGNSIVRLTPVARELWPRTASTLLLASTSMAVTLLAALPLGIAPGIWPGSKTGKLLDFCSAAAASLPQFWLGNLLILIFAVSLSWLPTAGDEGLLTLILPAMSIAIVQVPWTASLLRAALLNGSHAVHVCAARARGISRCGILFRHVLRPALAPVIAILGVQFAVLLEGAVIVETVFARPGLGRLAVDSVVARDFPVLLACVVTIGVVTTAASTLASFFQKWLDPRIH